jgi:hypothetical protein
MTPNDAAEASRTGTSTLAQDEARLLQGLHRGAPWAIYQFLTSRGQSRGYACEPDLEDDTGLPDPGMPTPTPGSAAAHDSLLGNGHRSSQWPGIAGRAGTKGP